MSDPISIFFHLLSSFSAPLALMSHHSSSAAAPVTNAAMRMSIPVSPPLK